MKSFCTILVVLCANSIFASDNFTGNNVTVELSGDNVTELYNESAKKHTKVSERVTSLNRDLEVYDSQMLEESLASLDSIISSGCYEDIKDYVNGLKEKSKWALKMDDANGRYSNGWFWGNTYWTGSRTLCENISPTISKQNIIQPSSKLPDHSLLSNSTHPRARRDAGIFISKPSFVPTLDASYTHGKLKQEDDLPFPVSFYMFKTVMNTTTFKSNSKVVHIGLCLPKKCSDNDAKTILTTTSSKSPTNLKIIKVRSHHEYYNLWQDLTFHIICGVTVAVVFMLILGTFYDLFLESKRNKMNNLAMNCTAFDLKSAKSVTMTLPRQEAKSNGKSSMYIVNNNVPVIEVCSTETSAESEEESRLDFYKVISEIVLSFSVRINMKAICDKSVGSDTIPVIHGLRSISMAWVILGHTCIVVFKYSDNMEFRKLVEKEFLFQTITNGAFSVDTFFFISGLLISFLYFRTNAKGKLEPLTQGSKGFLAGFLHFIGLIFYRFARLTMPYLYVLGLVEIMMKWFNYNSVFEPPTMDHVNCPNYWWRNILYINTLFPVDQMCMLWSWYLSDDTQFYIVGAIILILANSHFKTAAAMMVVLMLSSWFTTGYIAFINNHMPNLDDPLTLFDKIYDKPWTRLGPYLIGMIVGWILFKTNCSIRMAKLTVIVGWLASLAVLLSLLYGLYETNLTRTVGATYSSLSHSAWAASLAWIVIACSTGHGGYVNKILSATILYPFSRVTYCAYLVHPIVLRGMTMNMDSPLHLGRDMMAVIFLGQVVASYIFSFIISLAFEAPVVTMLKILTKIKSKKPNN